MQGDIPVSFNVAVWIATVVFQTIFFSVAGTWWFGRLINSIREEIALQRREIEQQIADLDNAMQTQRNAASREMHQTIESSMRLTTAAMEALKDRIQAVNERLYQHQVNAHETFAKRDTFSKAMDELKKSLSRLEDRLNDQK